MRPTQAKRGGGYLNNVDVTLTGYVFTVSPDQEIKKGKRKGQTWSPVNLSLTFQEDGADEGRTIRLLVSDADRTGYTISEDGLTLNLGEAGIFADNDAMVFINSAIENGFPETAFDEDPSTLNIEPMIGTRFRVIQVVNEAKTLLQGKQEGKDGKKYDRKDLKVESVLSLPTVAAKTNGKTKPVVAKGVKAKVAKGPDVSELAQSTLLDILSTQDDNSLPLAKLKMKVFAAFGAKHPQRDQRDAVISFLANGDNISTLEGIEFDGTTISA